MQHSCSRRTNTKIVTQSGIMYAALDFVVAVLEDWTLEPGRSGFMLGMVTVGIADDGTVDIETGEAEGLN